MGSITAVEIGADICALASTSVHKAELRVHAAETLDPAAFPGMEAFTLALQQTRRSLKLPRACRAVVWGLPDGATRKDPLVAPLVEPLTRAGFKVKRVVTPCNALGALARLRTSRMGGAMCWVGINRNGVAIVVIRPGKLLYSHSFAWDSNVGATGSQARLLQRYSLVAHLAPEVRRAIASAKQKGTTVDGIVTCGNLPDLRALTMPLIEELDIEVETLDSLEGLVMKPDLADRLAEVAPAIRLACAGAFARETRSVDESKRQVSGLSRAVQVLGAAAVIALVAGASWWFRSAPPAVKPAVAKSMPVKPAETKTAGKTGAPPVVNAPPAAAEVKNQSTASPVAAAPKSQPAAAPPPSIAPAAQTAVPSSSPPVAPGGKPAPISGPPSATAGAGKPTSVTVPAQPTAPAGKPAPVTPTATGTKSAAPPTTKMSQPPPASATNVAPQTPARNSTQAVPPSSPGKNSPPPSAALNSTPRPADKPEAASAARGNEKSLPELLKDPVPKVTAILVSADRRLATIGDEGQVVAVGDTIGRRVVVAIDDRTVLLREPSGVRIRVALGGRVVGVERSGRD
jgi:hypothetical protein